MLLRAESFIHSGITTSLICPLNPWFKSMILATLVFVNEISFFITGRWFHWLWDTLPVASSFAFPWIFATQGFFSLGRIHHHQHQPSRRKWIYSDMAQLERYFERFLGKQTMYHGFLKHWTYFSVSTKNDNVVLFNFLIPFPIERELFPWWPSQVPQPTCFPKSGGDPV